MTLSERVKYGSLDQDDLVDLVDSLESAQQQTQSLGALQDAIVSYPTEDCLQDQIETLQRLINSMRSSETRKIVNDVIDSLEIKQLELAQSAEYGIEIINSVLKS